MSLTLVPPIPTRASTPLRFPRDHAIRRRIFAEESFQHQAKANLHLLQWLTQTYSQPGDTLYDPMAGTGSLMIAALLGRHVLLSELEPHWLAIIEQNRLQLRQSAGLFEVGSITVQQADARTAEHPAGACDHVITSPPYFDTFSDWHAASDGLQREAGPHGAAYADNRGTPSTDPEKNIGNIHIYELYLRAMMQVYRTCLSLTRPGGRIILILKDCIRSGKRVPVTADNGSLLAALGCSLEARHEVAWPLSRYRRIHAQKYPDADQVETETVLVYQTPDRKAQSPRRHAFVIHPGNSYRPSSAPVLLYHKSLAHAQVTGHNPEIFPDAFREVPFRDRKAYCHSLLRALVNLRDVQAGDTVALYTPSRYTPYLRGRLETYGCTVTEPLAGLNMGQRLAWLTDQLRNTPS